MNDADPGATGEVLRAAAPSELLRWLYRNRERHGLAGDYRAYATYDLGSNRKSYVLRHYDRRLHALMELCPPGTRVLEIGSGHANELLWMALRGAKVTGIEPSSRLARISKMRQAALEADLRQKLDCQILNCNLFDSFDPGPYDLVFMREAFHHIEPREDAVPRIASLVRPGGHLIIAEANGWNPLIQLMLFRQRGFRTVKEAVDETGRRYPLGNERILTPGGLTRLFLPYGFRSRHVYFRLLPTRLAGYPWAAALAEWIERRAGDAWFLRPFCIHYEWIGTKRS
jgi:SAM-dependent methyltransferase